MNRPKLYWYQKGLEEKERIIASNQKKTLLIHACCAPCACFPLEWLNDAFEITIYYNNSNIYPESEYTRRRDELVRYIAIFNQEHQSNVKIIIPEYRNEEYMKPLEPLKDEPECGKRCVLCYSLRMDEAYAYANEHHFDYFTTVMTISRQKSSEKMNEIGAALEKKYPNTKYFYSDFKKKQGMDRAVQLQKEYEMYRQDYCGCIYSYQQAQERKMKKQSETQE